MKVIRCPLCWSKQFRKQWKWDKFAIQCQDCQLKIKIRTWKIPTRNELIRKEKLR